ncbi:hypothetical protein BDL97_19G084100 [Sphagnum fallax]|nr:hypothetical protein BDL97_19G084100 [Sphagnum fallax]
MLLLVICVPKVLSSFKSGSFMSKEARAGCLLVVTRGAHYCAGNIWKDLITTSLTGGACSLRKTSRFREAYNTTGAGAGIQKVMKHF